MLFVFTDFFSNLTIDKSYDDSNQNCEHHDIDGMAVLHDQFPILFQIFSDEGEEGVPYSCSDDGIDDELGQIHFSHQPAPVGTDGFN